MALADSTLRTPYYPNLVTYRRAQSRDLYGQVTLGEEVELRCKVRASDRPVFVMLPAERKRSHALALNGLGLFAFTRTGRSGDRVLRRPRWPERSRSSCRREHGRR